MIETGDKYLIEFSRGAKQSHGEGTPNKWAGLVKDGQLYGLNWMGEMHMLIQKWLKE
jgi:hypothetical protein